jgi:chromosome partitioning protein
MRVIAIMNQKGGVGKTTTTLNLAHALSRSGQVVVAIDMDPQAHLTAGFGLLARPQTGIGDVLIDADVSIKDTLLEARENLFVIPAGDRLGDLEHLQVGGAKRGFLLQEVIKKQLKRVDFILIDCPPSSGILGINSLLAAKEVLIPVSGDFFALQGLSRLMNIFSHIESSLKQKADKWVVLTRFQERRRLAKEVKEKVMEHFPNRVLQTAIRETVALAESPGFGQTIFEYQASGNGAEDYQLLAEDLLQGRVLH